MNVYAIAVYLTEDEKRTMVQRVYDRSAADPAASPPGYVLPVCADGQCPLGTLRPGWHAPTAATIARELADRGRGPRIAIELAAAGFVADWDRGLIPQAELATALGLTA